MPRMWITKRDPELPIYLLEPQAGSTSTSVGVEVDHEFGRRCEETQRAYNEMQRELSERYHASARD